MKGKFKKLLMLRWKGLPVGAFAIALVGAMLFTGAAYATYSVVTMTATVEVKESISVSEYGTNPGTVNFTNGMGDWDVDIHPGQTRALTLQVINSGVTIPVFLAAVGVGDGFDYGFEVRSGSSWVAYDSGGYSIGGGSDGRVRLNITADSSISPGPETFTFTISR